VREVDAELDLGSESESGEVGEVDEGDEVAEVAEVAEVDEVDEVDEVSDVRVGDDGCRRDGGTRATAMATG
jgi:hypothetical protein